VNSGEKGTKTNLGKNVEDFQILVTLHSKIKSPINGNYPTGYSAAAHSSKNNVILK
jgi:hypothetical protein